MSKSAYIKACIVCFEQYRTERIGTMYCSRTCRNKARSFSPKLLQAMIEKASRATQVVEVIPKAVLDYIKTHRESDNGSTSLVKDLDLLNLDANAKNTIVNEIRQLAEERRRQQIEKEIQDESKKKQRPPTTTIKVGDERLEVEYDPEMVDFNLDQELQDNLKFVYKTDQANGNADGFGVGSDGVIKPEVLPQPRVSKLRRVGEK